jgi:hypothetical protein
LHLQANEVLQATYFSPDRIPSYLLFGMRRRIEDVFLNRQGLVVCQMETWPFEPDMTRQELYARRDRSGLSRQDFYLKHFGPHLEQPARTEIGP